MTFSLVHLYTQVFDSIAALVPWHVVWMILLNLTLLHYYIILHLLFEGCTMDMSPPLEVETT